MSREHFSSLDGLRSLACLGIVVMHIQENLPMQSTRIPVVSDVIGVAGDFVLLFMMISAFSLCCGYLQNFQEGKISLEKFYTKRYKRILPFFALLTIIDVLFCCFSNHFVFSEIIIGELWEAFANFTLLFGLVSGNHISVIGVGWFIGVIFFFYLLFPFYSTLLTNKKKAWFAFAVSIMWSIAIKYYFAPVQGSFSGNTCMLVIAPYFMMAGIIYLYRNTLKSLMENRPLRIVTKTFVILYSFLYFLIPEIRFPYSNLLLYVLWLIYAIVEKNEKKSFLNNPVMKYISGISMEIYLCHMFFFRITESIHLGKLTNNPDVIFYTTFLLVVSGTILFSKAWKRVEKKIIK